MRGQRLQDSISRVAALFEYGELLASTDPAEFMDQVAAELTYLREIKRLAYEAAENAFGFLPSDILLAEIKMFDEREVCGMDDDLVVLARLELMRREDESSLQAAKPKGENDARP